MSKITVYKNTFVYEHKPYQKGFEQIIDNCDDCHPTLEAAEKAARETQKNMEQLENIRNFTFSTYPEEIEDTIIIDGKLLDNGCSYGDYAVIIKGNKEGQEYVLIENLLDKYKGHEVEITIKLKH